MPPQPMAPTRQTGPVAQGDVCNVEHVVGILIGQMNFQQLQALVQRLDQAKALGEQVHGADAAAGDRADLRRCLVMNVAGGKLRLEQ